MDHSTFHHNLHNLFQSLKVSSATLLDRYAPHPFGSPLEVFWKCARQKVIFMVVVFYGGSRDCLPAESCVEGFPVTKCDSLVS